MTALIRVKNHLKFLLISYRSCCYRLNGWLRLFGRRCRFTFAATDATSAAAIKSGVGVLHCICHCDGGLSVSGVNKSSSAIYYKVLKYSSRKILT